MQRRPRSKSKGKGWHQEKQETRKKQTETTRNQDRRLNFPRAALAPRFLDSQYDNRNPRDKEERNHFRTLIEGSNRTLPVRALDTLCAMWEGERSNNVALVGGGVAFPRTPHCWGRIWCPAQTHRHKSSCSAMPIDHPQCRTPYKQAFPSTPETSRMPGRPKHIYKSPARTRTAGLGRRVPWPILSRAKRSNKFEVG